MAPLFCGDPHGEFHHIIEAVKAYRPPAIFLLGDLEPRAPLHEILEEIIPLTDIWWIPGNHDVDKPEYFDRLYGSELGNKSLHGRAVEIPLGNGQAITVAGLGGEFDEEIWLPPGEEKFLTRSDYEAHLTNQLTWQLMSPEKVAGLRLKARGSIFFDEFYELSTRKADILITHEAPACHPRGQEVIDHLAGSLHAKKVFHGHHHDCLNYASYPAPFRAHGVGLRGITNIHGEKIIPGLLDEMRATRRPSPGV